MKIKEYFSKKHTSMKNWCKTHKKLIYFWLYIFSFCFITVFMMGYIQRYSFGNPFRTTFGWIYHFPLSFLINCLVIYLLVVFIWLITKKMYLGTIFVSIITSVITTIDYFKLVIRGEPFYPVDILFPGEAGNIVGVTKLVLPFSIIVFYVILILLCIIAIFIKAPIIRRRSRLLFSVIIVIFCTVSFPVYFLNKDNQILIGIEDSIWNQKYNYEHNGLLNAFLMQTRYINIEKPKGYTKAAAEKLLKTESKNISSTNNTPNVIMIMNESFWDPTRLPNVTYNVDPLENFHALQKESLYGDLLVEPFGGNTANTEFEVLTGFSMNALPGGVAYQQYIKKQLPSLPSLLKSQGYSTVAIHPYLDWFWNRKVVYPLLDIDKFYDISSFSNNDNKGEYVSDISVGNKIISNYESTRSAGKPYFAHVVTIQNHGWYNTDRYKGDQQQIVASSNVIDKEKLLELDTYTQGVKDADSNLANLVKYFSNVKEPTIIAFYGDHLPSIGDDYGIYRSSGYVSKGEFSDKDESNLHKTPFLIWSNTDKTSKNIGTINANYLTPIMLSNANMKMTDYFSYLQTQMDGVKACNKSVCVDSNGKYTSAKTGANKNKLTNQAILQYYFMFN